MTLEIFQQLASIEAAVIAPRLMDQSMNYISTNVKAKYETMLQDVSFQMKHTTGPFSVSTIVKYHVAIFADEAANA